MAEAATSGDRAPGEGFLVLWTGDMATRERDVQVELKKDGVRVEEVRADELVVRASRRAPDLIVLAGALGASPDAPVARLAETLPVIPIVTLGPTADARPKPRSRYGLIARFDGEARTDHVAKQIGTLLHGLSRRAPRWRISATLEDIPGLARRSVVSGRCGLLAAASGGAIAIDPSSSDERGRLAPDPQLLVAALAGAAEIELTLHERPSGSVRVLREAPLARDAPHRELAGSRLLVIDTDVERGRRLAAGLAKRGAEARGIGAVAQAIHASRAHDPMAIVIVADALLETATSSLWDEPRYAASSLLVLDAEAAQLSDEALVGPLAGFAAPELALTERLKKGDAVAERLESIGAARWLKVLGRCAHDVTLRVYTSAGRARVDLSEGKIQGAAFRPSDPRANVIEGRGAVEALLQLPFGRVLAGPPDALAQLDGTRRARKPSVVGRIMASPPSGVRRLVAEEVVQKHTDATRAPRLDQMTPEKRSRLLAETPPEIGGDDDDDDATQTYSADHMEALRAQIARAAEDDAPVERGAEEPPPRSGEREAPLRLERAPALAITPVAGTPVAASRLASAEEPAAATSPASSPRSSAEEREAPTPKTASAPEPSSPARSTAAPSSASPTKQPAQRSAKRSAESPTDASAAPAREAAAATPKSRAPAEPSASAVSAEEPVAANGAATEARARGAGTGWLVAAALIALGVGGYAAWELGLVPSGATTASPAPQASTPAPVEPPPEPEVEPVVAEPVAEPPPRPRVAAVTPSEAPEEPSVEEPVEDVDSPPEDQENVAEDAVAEAPVVAAEAEARPEEPAAAPAEAPIDPALPEPEDATSIGALLEASAEAAREGDYARSETIARRVLDGSPRNAPAAYRLAVALFRLRRYDDAIEWARRASEWDPESPLPISLEGDVYMRNGRFHQAARAYRRALEVEPRFGPAQRRLDLLRERGVE